MKPTWDTLSEIEIKALQALFPDRLVDEMTVSGKSGLQLDQARRALAWLSTKELASEKTESIPVRVLTKAGQQCLGEGFPEERVLQLLEKNGGKQPLSKLQKESGLDREFFFVIGQLKPKNYVTLSKEGSEQIVESHLADFRDLFEEEMQAKKKALQAVANGENTDDVQLGLLKNRAFVEEKTVTKRSYQLTKLGLEALQQVSKSVGQVSELTSDMIQNKSFANVSFRSFDLNSPVANARQGKKQPYMAFLEQIREKLSEMGFAELNAPLITTEFYNFDALFQPQNHSARTIHDTYQLKHPKLGKLPSPEIVRRVKAAHEHGGKSGSTGWGYEWDEMVAKKLMPLSHDTAHSPAALIGGAKKPGKYYTIARVFRPDVIDAKHLVEFNQLGGFVLDDSLTVRHLLGLLKEFAIEVGGCEKVKFMPAYFPFTEPSVQLSAKHPQLGWVELGGSGMFRPEMMEALGYPGLQCPAWGLGLDRLAMFKMDIGDIRHLFSEDLNWLRAQPLVKL